MVLVGSLPSKPQQTKLEPAEAVVERWEFVPVGQLPSELLKTNFAAVGAVME